MNSSDKTLIGGGSIDGAIHKAAGPGFLDQYQKLNSYKTGGYGVTLGCKLPAKYVFHTVRPRDKNDYKLNDCYKSCLSKVYAYNTNIYSVLITVLVAARL